MKPIAYDFNGSMGPLFAVNHYIRTGLFGIPVIIGFHTRTIDNFISIRVSIKGPNPLDELIKFPGENKQNIEQKIYVPDFSLEVVPFTNIIAGEVDTCRQMVGATIRRFEQIVDHFRKTIPVQFSTDYADSMSNYVNAVYPRFNKDNVKDAMTKIDWKVLFVKANTTEAFVNSFDYMMKHAMPRHYVLNEESDIESLYKVSSIDLSVLEGQRALQRIEQERRNAEAREREMESRLNATGATKKATELLALVCGPERTKKYLEKGEIELELRGYLFILRPGKWIQVRDPNGHEAEFCIHTANHSCHPLDEVTLAYLNLRHKFEEFCKTAIVHNQRGQWVHPLKWKEEMRKEKNQALA